MQGFGAARGLVHIRRGKGAACLLVGGVALSLVLHRPAAGQAGLSARSEVRQVEAGFPLGGDVLRLRVHLTTGQALEYETRDPAEAQRILELVRIFATQRTRLFVELDRNTLKAVHASVP